jgi:hypothetical protein
MLLWRIMISHLGLRGWNPMCLDAALEMCGDWDRADKYYQRGAEIRQRVLGPAHPLTVAALEQREVRKECVQYIDRFTDSVRPLVVRTVLYHIAVI